MIHLRIRNRWWDIGLWSRRTWYVQDMPPFHTFGPFIHG